MSLGVRAVREALDVVAARGVNPGTHPEARRILKTPTWLACLVAAYDIRFTEQGRRLLRASDFTNSAEEMKRFYFDVLNTGKSLGVAMPHLAAFRRPGWLGVAQLTAAWKRGRPSAPLAAG